MTVISDVYFDIAVIFCWHIVTPFTLYAVLVYFQMNYGLFLYSNLAKVDVGNVSKKGENMEGIIS